MLRMMVDETILWILPDWSLFLGKSRIQLRRPVISPSGESDGDGAEGGVQEERNGMQVPLLRVSESQLQRRGDGLGSTAALFLLKKGRSGQHFLFLQLIENKDVNCKVGRR